MYYVLCIMYYVNNIFDYSNLLFFVYDFYDFYDLYDFYVFLQN